MTTEPIIGAEWAERYPDRYALSQLRETGLERHACPVCGHPTGDCTPHQEVLMAQGTPAKKAAAKRAPAKAAAKAPEPTTPDPAPKVEEDTRSAAEIAAAEADASQPKEEGTGLPLGQPAEGKPVGVNEEGDVTGGTHAVSVAADEAPRPGPRRVKKETVPDGFREDAGTLVADKAISVRFTPQNATRKSQLLVFPAGSRWTKQAVIDRLALYADREDAELV